MIGFQIAATGVILMLIMQILDKAFGYSTWIGLIGIISAAAIPIGLLMSIWS